MTSGWVKTLKPTRRGGGRMYNPAPPVAFNPSTPVEAGIGRGGGGGVRTAPPFLNPSSLVETLWWRPIHEGGGVGCTVLPASSLNPSAFPKEACTEGLVGRTPPPPATASVVVGAAANMGGVEVACVDRYLEKAGGHRFCRRPLTSIV